MTPLALCVLVLAAGAPAPQTQVAETQAVSAHLNVGFPWAGVAVAKPLSRWSLVTLESDTSFAKRWETRAGIHRRFEIGSSWIFALGAGAGWVIQKPSVARQGAQGFGRFKMAYNARVSPWATLDYRFLAALEQRSIQRPAGTRREWRMSPYNSLLAQLGVLVPVHTSWAIGARLVFGEMDGVFAIPGASFGLRWRAR